MLLFFLIKTVFLSELEAVEQMMKVLEIKLMIAKDWLKAINLAQTSLQIDAGKLIGEAENEQEIKELLIGALDEILRPNLQHLKEYLDQCKVIESSKEDLSDKEISDEISVLKWYYQ